MTGVHEDFGEKIGGAKKDLWKDRGLYADDLETMNEREAEKFVKKDNVWKKPDYAAMLEEGIPLGVVYFIKKARDGLNASPQYYRTDDTPEKRIERQKEYIETVRELQTVLSDVRTVEDAAKAYDRFFVDNGYLEKVQGWGSGIHYRATKKGQDNPVITNKLSNTMLIRSAEYFERNFTQKAKKEQFCVSKEQKIPKGYAIHFNDGKHTYSKNEQQAAATQTINRALEYLRTPEIEHTGNQWKDTDNWRADQKISNRVYQMTCSIWEDTKYDRETKQSVPIAWYVTWEVRIHSPKQGYGAKIAGQNQKRYTDKNAAIKYLDGRKKAYSHLFTEISPPIPKEYEHHFMVHGTLLPGYTVEGLEQAKTEHASAEVSEGGIFTPENREKPSVLGKLSVAKTQEKTPAAPGTAMKKKEDIQL